MLPVHVDLSAALRVFGGCVVEARQFLCAGREQ